MRRAWCAGTVLWVAVVLAAVPGHANGGIAMAVDVHNSSQTVRDRENGICTWQVVSDVVIVNLKSEPITLDEVAYAVSWIGPDDRSGVVTNVDVIDDGGLRPGVTIPADGRRTFSPLSVQFGIPCDATFGDLAVRVTSALGTGSGDAPFLEDGTPVPPEAVGALGLAVLIAGALVMADRRRRLALIPGTSPGRSRKVAS